MKTTHLLLSLAATLGCAILPFTPARAADAPVAKTKPSATPTETKEHKDARMAWFRDARFGMFIHWGLYALPAGEWKGKTNYGEWFLEETKMPVSQYEQYAKQFNPVKFDAKQWVAIAKNAGMKYIVITSKHHDGFGMYPSDLTDWCIKSTPFKRDPLQELADACQEAGIRFCVYHSIMDWHHPDWGKRRAWNDRATGEPDMDRFTVYLKGQLKELVTRYHPGILWFDGEWETPWNDERGLDLYAYLRELDPKLIINNRVGKKRAGMAGMDSDKGGVGDYGTPEQTIPANGFGPGVDWESCMTINGHWGYNKNDLKFKSTETLLRNLIDIASKGGNYLLNVGPDAEGVIPAGEVERIAEMGKWLQVNGEAIYGTSATPFGEEAGAFSATEKDKKGQPVFKPTWNWRCTVKPGTTYIHILKWPGTSFTLDTKGKLGAVTKAYMLADSNKTAMTVTMNGTKLTVALPEKAPDSIASVLVLETAAK